ncbi:hypothetical protein BDV97DRAFT_187504, partial [Delphinella strobiligena]
RSTEPRKNINIENTINNIIYYNKYKLIRLNHYRFAVMNPPNPAFIVRGAPPGAGRPQPIPPSTPLDALLEPYTQLILSNHILTDQMLNTLLDKLSEHADEPEYARVFERMLETLLVHTMGQNRDIELSRRIYASPHAGPTLVSIASTLIVVQEALEARRSGVD